MKLKIAHNSLWVCYSLMNPQTMDYLIPSHLKVADVSPLQGMPPQKMLLFNAYQLESRWMNGARLDIQTFTRDRISNKPHLVVLDVLSNTRSWDPLNGIMSPNCNVSTKNVHGIDLHFKGAERFSVTAKRKRNRPIDYTFCVEANRKCFFKNYKKGFNLDFKEEELMHPVTELKDVKIENTCWDEFRGDFVSAFKHNSPMDFDVVVNPFRFGLG